MTFSLLARDPKTGALGGVAATGNLCVGGWVLRGDARAGMSASQGRTPSTLWGEDALSGLRDGGSPMDVLAQIVEADGGRNARQMSLLARDGSTACFDGASNHPYTGHLQGEDWIVAGNWLSSVRVIERTAEAYSNDRSRFEERLLSALAAGVSAGSDTRGTLSAALLVVAVDRPPLTLRVDWDEDPVSRLAELFNRTQDADYRAWQESLPTRANPEGT